MVKEYKLIRITIPGVFYTKSVGILTDTSKKGKKIKKNSPNYEEEQKEWDYADNLQDSIGIIMNQISLINDDLYYELVAYTVYVNGITVTLSDGQFEYL